jgi:hypothetical protein
MTNILSLPKLRGDFTIARNADWLDTIYFTAPGQPTEVLQKTCAVIAGLHTVQVSGGTSGLVNGMPVVGPEIPANTRIINVSSSTFDMISGVNGMPVGPLLTNAATVLSFLPIPIDLSGIEFAGEVRKAVGKHEVFLRIGTSTGTLINGGASGYLSFNVLRGQLAAIYAGEYVFDLVAAGDGHYVNLFPTAPAVLTVNEGITT